MINSYFSRIIYSMYFMVRKSGSISYFSIDIGYLIFCLSILSTIQVVSATSFISILSVYFSGNGITLEPSYSYFILALVFVFFWFSLGGLKGMQNSINLYDAAPYIDGEMIFNKTFGKYLLLTLVAFLLGLACAFFEGKLIRGELP